MKTLMKPMSSGSLFDNAFRMSFGRFKDVLQINIMFFLFLAAAAAGLIAATGILSGSFRLFSFLLNRNGLKNFSDVYEHFLLILERIINGKHLEAAFLAIAVFAAVILLVIVLYNGIIYDLFIRTFTGEPWKFRNSLKTVWKKSGSLLFSLLPSAGIIIAFILGAIIVTGFMSLVISIIGMIVSIAGSVIFFLYGIVVLEMVAPAVINENMSGGRAVTRAFVLGNYNILGVAWVYLMFIVLNIMASLLLSSVFALFKYLLFNSAILLEVSDIVYAVFYIIINLFIEAIGSALVVSIYFNQKIKYESYGVEKLIDDYVGDKN